MGKEVNNPAMIAWVIRKPKTPIGKGRVMHFTASCNKAYVKEVAMREFGYSDDVQVYKKEKPHESKSNKEEDGIEPNRILECHWSDAERRS